jgi:MYXO-CTERM domain-containing protein
MNCLPRFLSSLPAASLAFALLSASSEARADGSTPCEFPNDPTFRCFKSDPVTVSKTAANIPFDNKLNTGWLNCENVPANYPCSQQPPGKCNTLGACLQVAMDDSKLDIAMLHQWDVYWPQVNALQLFPRKPPKEGGSFSFTYKLTPTFSIMIDALNNKWFFSVDPTQILDILDKSGTVKEFSSSASGSCKFAPFAFDPPVVCPGQSTNGTIFSFGLSDIGIDIDEYVKIALGLDAGTADVVFTWQTDEISVKGGDAPITKDSPSTSIPYTGGSEVSATVQAKGKLTYSGKTFLAPTIEVTEVAGFPLKFKWPIDVGADLPFQGTIPITLNPTNFTIQLPDLTVIAALNSAGAIDFGEVIVGEQKTKSVTLKNFGAINAVGETLSSQAGDFKVAKAAFDLDPDEEEKVEITFLPKKEGKVEATIFFNSNDPDEPEQSIKVTGFGRMPSEGSGGDGGSGGSSSAGAGGSDAGTGGSGGKKPNLANPSTEESASNGGCGCRTSGSPPPGAASLALLAFAGLLARRRRSS